MLHAPAPITLPVPNDWNQLSTYLLVIPLAGAGMVAVAQAGPAAGLGTYAVAAALAILGAPVLWVAARVTSFARERRELVFDKDAVQIPRLSPFGKARRVAYGDVQAMESIRHGYRLRLADGAVTFRSSAFGGHYYRAPAALALRIGYAMELDERFSEAVAMYELASPQYEPPLLARLAVASEKDDELEDALDYYLEAEWELRDAYGAEHPAVRELQAELARFRTAHPGVDSFGLRDQEDLVEAKRARLVKQPHDEPSLRDD